MINQERPLPVFLVHYTPLVERRTRLESSLPKVWDVSWIQDFDRESLGDLGTLDHTPSGRTHIYDRLEQVTLAHSLGIRFRRTSWSRLFAAAAFCEAVGLTKWGPLRDRMGLQVRKLRPVEVSILLKHRRALEIISTTSSAEKLSLVLEDDAIVTSDTERRIADVLKWWENECTAAPRGVYIDVGGGCDLRPRDGTPIGPGLWPMHPPRSRTACAYLIDARAAAALRSELTSPSALFGPPLDFAYTAALLRNDIPVYWLEPAAFIHGSQSGIYKSATRE